MSLINEGFAPKHQKNDRLPPGQYETKGFPVLSFGPTPRIDLSDWTLDVFGLVEKELSFNWNEFNKLESEEIKTDIHCVTKWSKFETSWKGVSLDQILKLAEIKKNATHLIAHSYDGYTTNLPIEDISLGKAWVATYFDGVALDKEHGGPARLLVPHLYLWKSAKWLKALEFIDHDEPGFWETRGYHNYGNPWKEQRYTFD